MDDSQTPAVPGEAFHLYYMYISPLAQKLYDAAPQPCFMTERTLGKLLTTRASNIRAAKDELEAAGMVKINYLPNGRRRNPKHEMIKLPSSKTPPRRSNNGSPIYKHILKRRWAPVVLNEWADLSRDQLVEIYIRSGLNIIPFEAGGKTPMRGMTVPLWNQFTDDKKMEFFWDRPRLNIGLIMPANLMVVDIDSKVNEWIDHARFTKTLAVSTPHGYHFYFKNDAVVTTSTRALENCDARCTGSFVVLPPSVNADGVQYQWDNLVLPLALPQEFRKQWQMDRYLANISAGGDFELSDRIPKGERNDTLWRYGRQMRAQGKPESVIATVISETNRSLCSPPLSYTEVDVLIRNIITRADRPGFKRYRP